MGSNLTADGNALDELQWDFIGSCRSATLVTSKADGSPRPVPICFARLGGAIVTPLDDKPKRAAEPRALARVRDIEARPAVVVLFQRWHEDWGRLAWLRVSGTATLRGPGGDEHADAVRRLRERYPQYVDHALERRPMIWIDPTSATAWGPLRTA